MKTLVTRISLLLLVFQLTSTQNTDIQIHPVENLLLPIDLGHAKIIYTKHTFLHFLDIKNIVEQVEQLIINFNKFKNTITYDHNITNHIAYHSLAQNNLVRTEILTQLVQKKLENLHPHIRSKRGLINGLGKVNKWLFGNLDSDDEERYNKAINTLQKNQKNLIEETNQQVSLYKKLINHYNQSITTLSKNQENFANTLGKIQISIQNKITDLNTFISFQGSISQINLECQNLINILDNLENAISFSKLNTLHNSIISSTDIIEMLKHLSNIYKENQIPNFKNILTYYQFLGTQVTFTNNKLIFAIHIPILKIDTYEFLRLNPIIQNSKMFIPNYPFLARKNKQAQFEKSQCPVLEEIYYCQQNFATQDECTLQLLDGNTPTNCHLLDVNIQETITQQLTRDEILIIPATTEKIYSECVSNQYLKITKPTLFKIPQSCQIRIKEETYVNKEQIQEGKPWILPKFNVEETKYPADFKKSNITKINFENLFEINKIAKSLKPIKEEEDTLYNQPLTTSILMTICIFIIIYLLWNHRSKLTQVCTRRKPQETDIELENNPNQGTSKNQSLIFSS